ncbi:hypothetical protein APB26_32575 [Pseudomonas aeruginosa]|uniref:hypothetical protein n=1 Tax=Pseudomonas aeruginosa TaxID=287 RepID=UPI00071B278F|nr:hypothetical protein [Pseudomonas aeruginosa]KSQ21718.1 hypothetical protein APB26_32575 [Pseudomonas aeruginosa]RPV61390.1 hypothetical protein IPC838_18910 [Pseudomonas aeruginosa]
MTSFTILQGHSFLRHATDEIGMPNLDFEIFYQQGLTCHRWGLPRLYVRQALRSVIKSWRARFRRPVEFWQLRAFAYGLRGLCDGGTRPRRVSSDYQWPLPPDVSWDTVLCLYPDGKCDLDFVHPVSRVFWSEKNGFLELPSYDPLVMGGWWFEAMGFEILRMQPGMIVRVQEESRPARLKAVL